MVKLRAKGNNEYVAMHRAPSVHAEMNTRPILAAFFTAAEQLIELTGPDISDEIRNQAFLTFLSLRELHQSASDEMDQLAILLQVAESRLTRIEE